MSEVKSITKEQISQLPVEEFGGEIIVIETEIEVENAINQLSGHSIVGFDTETKPVYKKGNPRGVALMQLSTNDICYLFRINKLGFPSCLLDFLINPKVKKIGLSLKDDFASMNRRSKVDFKGFEDLQQLVPHYGISDSSLQKVYALLFEKKISKSQRLTNWEADSLTIAQKKYAALDAWACLKIYQKLINGGNSEKNILAS